jgi:hypothetical protein
MATNESELILVRCELEPVEAWALAQLCKRIDLGALARCAVNTDEAYTMARAMHELRKALGREGFAPR